MLGVLKIQHEYTTTSKGLRQVQLKIRRFLYSPSHLLLWHCRVNLTCTFWFAWYKHLARGDVFKYYTRANKFSKNLKKYSTSRESSSLAPSSARPGPPGPPSVVELVPHQPSPGMEGLEEDDSPEERHKGSGERGDGEHQ